MNRPCGTGIIAFQIGSVFTAASICFFLGSDMRLVMMLVTGWLFGLIQAYFFWSKPK